MKQTYCMKCMRPNGGTEVCPHCGYVSGENEIPPHVLRPGTLLKDQYLLGEPLGQGGFGITYIARDVNLDIRVAVKEYYPNGYAVRTAAATDRVTIADEQIRQNVQRGKEDFLKEARTLARFKGTPGIVDVLNFFEANDTAYIVMEFLEGETLGRRLRQQLFTADEIFRLMEPVFDTLEKIHRQDVVHRDVSPDNIMMLPDGRLKLMDFGAARLMNHTDQRSVSVVLKAGYAPKEQYTSRGKQGPWTDIYALCATIYKCITGDTPDDAMDRVEGDSLRWPSELGFLISPRQEAVLKKGMAVFQKDRFQSIGELRAELTAAEDAVPGPAAEEAKPSADGDAAPAKGLPTEPAEDEPAHSSKTKDRKEADRERGFLQLLPETDGADSEPTQAMAKRGGEGSNRLKINMGGPGKAAYAPEASAFTPDPIPTGQPDAAGSRLKINMGGRKTVYDGSAGKSGSPRAMSAGPSPSVPRAAKPMAGGAKATPAHSPYAAQSPQKRYEQRIGTENVAPSRDGRPAAQKTFLARLFRTRLNEPTPSKAVRLKLIIAIAVLSLIVIVAAVMLAVLVLIPGSRYTRAETLFTGGGYLETTAVFNELGDYRDSDAFAVKCRMALGDPIAAYDHTQSGVRSAALR